MDNANTKEFLKKYCKKHHVTIQEAEEDAVVQNVNDYYVERDLKKVIIKKGGENANG